MPSCVQKINSEIMLEKNTLKNLSEIDLMKIDWAMVTSQ